MNKLNGRWLRGTIVVAAFAAVAGGCAGLGDFFAPASPGLTAEWEPLLNEVRVYERRIGFDSTDNFVALSQGQREFQFCAYAPRLVLPYSYQDPVIRRLDSATEEDCRARASSHDADVFFATLEAWGEIGTPVTPAMIEGKLDRFLYLVIHEDCHDQFKLPYGVEEALCDLITYKGMTVFTGEKYGPNAREHRAVQRYADAQASQARATILYYDRLANVYARYDRREISADQLMRERAGIFDAAKKPLAFLTGDLNNVSIANHMTYCRHYPFLETVFDALGRDVARTVAFFRQVDALRPSPADVMQRHGIVAEKSLEFVRANEAAVIETIRKLLANEKTKGART